MILSNSKTILISPLEWGLGHAGRIIPIARELHARGHRVIIASGETHIAFLKGELPEHEHIPLPGFRIRYSGIFPQYLVIMAKLPSFIYHCIRENIDLRRKIREYSVDIVISDSRIGLRNKRIKSVLILHFPSVPLPGFMKFMHYPMLLLSRLVMKRFTSCYIPDLPGDENLTGKLSHGLKLPGNTRFIGILSRFSNYNMQGRDPYMKIKYAVILSGPEPQRKILKQILTGVLLKTGERTVILEGEPSTGYHERTRENITFISHLPGDEMLQLIRNTEVVIARSGYTSIMELVSMAKKAVLIPTPGQTEQEYLAGYLADKGWFAKLSQKECDKLQDINVPSHKLPDHINKDSHRLLDEALGELLEK